MDTILIEGILNLLKSELTPLLLTPTAWICNAHLRVLRGTSRLSLPVETNNNGARSCTTTMAIGTKATSGTTKGMARVSIFVQIKRKEAIMSITVFGETTSEKAKANAFSTMETSTWASGFMEKDMAKENTFTARETSIMVNGEGT
jgi:hypothetical protein